MEHAGPSRPRGQMGNSIQEVQQPPVEGPVHFVFTGALNRPVDDHRAANDCFAVYKPPESAVPTVIAIIAHREVFVRWDYKLPIMNVCKDLTGPLRLHISLQILCAA